MNTPKTATIPADIAKELAEQVREDLEHTAEKSADYRTRAHCVRKQGMDAACNAEIAAVYFNEADKLDEKADRLDREFNRLERIAIALTKAGV